MPLYDFACPACGARFEAQVPHGTLPPCQACGVEPTERVFSAFAGPFTVRPRGAEARRVDAARKTREDQRAERREQRRAQREHP
jgi:putative FmdB family regulatory protein